MKRVLMLGTALAMLGAFVPMRANAGWVATTNFSMGTAKIQAIGDELNSPFDALTIAAGAGQTSVDFQSISLLSFDVGVNCTVCNKTPQATLSSVFTLGGLTQSFDLVYSWASDGPNDTLSFTAPGPITFVSLPGTDGENIEAIFGPLTPMSGGIGTYSQSLSARFEVPEPFSIALLGIGLFGLGAVRNRRA
jgi:PEP-CTERM motif